MMGKKTHFGRAGEYFAMSELLLRGWNVAVPVVDVGDDVFVIDDNKKTTWRLQVKSSAVEKVPRKDDGGVRARFTLSRVQLRVEQPIELFYMLMLRVDDAWRFLVIPRVKLAEIRDLHIEASSVRAGRGKRPVGDSSAKSDALGLDVVLDDDGARGWGALLTPYLDRWPDDLAPVEGGPGAIELARRSAMAAPRVTGLAAGRGRSRDREK